MRTIRTEKVAGFDLKIEQREDRHGRFRITYGAQVRDDLSYVEAAHEYGECLFHALACDGALNNEGDY